MTPIHRDFWFTFRFGDDRIIPRSIWEANGAGQDNHLVGDGGHSTWGGFKAVLLL
jgi:hypothetical protein